MTAPARSGATGPVPALVFTLVGFFALSVMGLGLASLGAGTAVVPVAGLGPFPEVWGMLAAMAAYAVTVWPAVRRQRPTYRSVVLVGIFVWLVYVLVIGAASGIAAADLGVGFAVTGMLAVGWPSLVVAGAAVVAAWCAIALRRTRAAPPAWPWERDAPEE